MFFESVVLCGLSDKVTTVVAEGLSYNIEIILAHISLLADIQSKHRAHWVNR